MGEANLLAFVGSILTAVLGAFGIWLTQRGSQRVAAIGAQSSPYRELAERLARVEDRCERLDREAVDLQRRLARAELEHLAHRARIAQLVAELKRHKIDVPPWTNDPATWEPDPHPQTGATPAPRQIQVNT